MPLFHAIAAMSENRVIGDHGKIPWHLPEDFRWFKHKTMGGTLVMGRKTFESIGKPLPGRKTIVLSRGGAATPEVEVYPTVPELMRHTEEYPGTIWVCGGAEIYEQLLPSCSVLYLTHVKKRMAGDTFFPAFEEEFLFNQIVHETSEFRIERWLNREQLGKSSVDCEGEAWPF